MKSWVGAGFFVFVGLLGIVAVPPGGATPLLQQMLVNGALSDNVKGAPGGAKVSATAAASGDRLCLVDDAGLYVGRGARHVAETCAEYRATVARASQANRQYELWLCYLLDPCFKQEMSMPSLPGEQSR